ncbi:uncharacterized protein LOC117178067 [Belonocnema kinseyi]|uniref:uncharacterized protein LOC117178067 n=1 Tax=Belonocnema kinseyi TaxID=2817044 RepID=UPI00143DB9CD|nr:uncharacterized protein LOC117178067 [Belonocnema kinseyi]
MCFYKRDNSTKYNADEFLLFCSDKMTEKLCTDAEENTKEQSDECLWHTLRQFRVTASKISETSKCNTPEGVLKESIFGAQMYDSVYMERGRLLEKEIIKELETEYETKIKKVGLMLSSSLPALGASPDGISEEFVVEIKCPAKVSTVKNYISLKGDVVKKY